MALSIETRFTKDMKKMASIQGYYYVCSGCGYMTLSSNDFEHTCSKIVIHRKTGKKEPEILPYYPMRCVNVNPDA